MVAPPAPNRYPDEANAARNALSAATAMHRQSQSQSHRTPNNDLPGFSDAEADKIHAAATTRMGRDMYGSNPVIGPALDRKKYEEGLHAAAVSMAQSMFAKSEKQTRERVNATSHRHRAAGGTRDLDEDSDEGEGVSNAYGGLHERAQQLAAARLAQIDKTDHFKEYYGTAQTQPPRSRMSILGRRRSSSEGQGLDDAANSRRIRGEMNLFNDKLAEIDKNKRQTDRDALMAAAQRKVRLSMDNMDEKVFQQTGKMSPAMKAEWEAKARAKAQADSDGRMVNHGKVAIGGGKYLDQSEVDAIALNRVQPTLDAISAKAAHDRQVDEDRRLAEEERKRAEEDEKMERKYQDMKVKEEWQKFKGEEKTVQDQKADEERMARMNEGLKNQMSKDEWKQFKGEEASNKDACPVLANI